MKKFVADKEVEPRKRKRVAFSKLGDGIKANECIKIYIVSSKEEVNFMCTSPICPVDLNNFFGEDGKIYGYHDLKITIWINSISFEAYADIAFRSTCDGEKAQMDLRPCLQRIFGETLLENKDDFLKSFSPENNLIGSILSDAETLRQNSSTGLINQHPHGLLEAAAATAITTAAAATATATVIADTATAATTAALIADTATAATTAAVIADTATAATTVAMADIAPATATVATADIAPATAAAAATVATAATTAADIATAAVYDLKVVRLVMGNSNAGHLYCVLVPLVLLLIEGSNPIDITDPKWELYVLIQMKNDEEKEPSEQRIVAFAAVYRFYHYPESYRLRLSQILVLPAYQHKGYGRYLVDTLNNVAISEDVYDLTVEEPLDYFQNMRTCIDVIRLLGFDQIKNELNNAVSQLKLGVSSTSLLIPPSGVTQDVRKAFRMNRKQLLCCWEVLIFMGLLHGTEDYLESYVAAISSHIKGGLLGKDFDENRRKRVMDVSNEYDPDMSFVMFQSPLGDGGGSFHTQKNAVTAKQEQQIQQIVDERIQDIKLIAQKVHLFSNF